MYLTENTVLPLERTVGYCCTGKESLVVVGITLNT